MHFEATKRKPEAESRQNVMIHKTLYENIAEDARAAPFILLFNSNAGYAGIAVK